MADEVGLGLSGVAKLAEGLLSAGGTRLATTGVERRTTSDFGNGYEHKRPVPDVLKTDTKYLSLCVNFLCRNCVYNI